MPLSRDKDTVSPKVDEGNSRTQHSDISRKYTPEMSFGELRESSYGTAEAVPFQNKFKLVP
jgi:hypothetical protein